jgi:hypothetical protein
MIRTPFGDMIDNLPTRENTVFLDKKIFLSKSKDQNFITIGDKLYILRDTGWTAEFAKIDFNV